MHATCRYDLWIQNGFLHFDLHQAGIQPDDSTTDARKCESRYKYALELVFVLGAEDSGLNHILHSEQQVEYERPPQVVLQQLVQPCGGVTGRECNLYFAEYTAKFAALLLEHQQLPEFAESTRRGWISSRRALGPLPQALLRSRQTIFRK